jgi:hypothetical protein
MDTPANVVDVAGNVIVVESVPENVRDCVIVSVFPADIDNADVAVPSKYVLSATF